MVESKAPLTPVAKATPVVRWPRSLRRPRRPNKRLPDQCCRNDRARISRKPSRAWGRQKAITKRESSPRRYPSSFPAQERIIFEIQIPHAMQFFKALENGNAQGSSRVHAEDHQTQRHHAARSAPRPPLSLRPEDLADRWSKFRDHRPPAANNRRLWRPA